jgi:hypothetical protein
LIFRKSEFLDQPSIAGNVFTLGTCRGHSGTTLLRTSLTDVIGPLTEEEVEKFETGIHDSNGQETLITRITDKILHSRQFVYLL